MKFDLLVKKLLTEAIPLHVAKNALCRKHSNNYNDPLLNRVFGNKDRIIIPYDNKAKKSNRYWKIVDSYTYKQIFNFLKEKDYIVIPDFYIKGLARNKTDNNFYKIGKILQKFGKDDLLNLFKKDMNRQISDDDYVIVISRHPYDLAGASTDRNWTSCYDNKYEPIVYKNKNRKGQDSYDNGKVYDKSYFDQDKTRYEHQKEKGGLIAYLVNKKEVMPNGKVELRRPISRILLSEYEKDDESDNPEIIGYYISNDEGKYGVHDEVFEQQVQDWLIENDLLPHEFHPDYDEEELEDDV